MIKRSEVIDIAKQVVLAHGPSHAVEFTGELIENLGYREKTAEYEALRAEVTKQAIRVYNFLGYDAPFGL